MTVNPSIFLLLAVLTIIMAKPISLEDQWENFKSTHGKTYGLEEDGKRFTIFKENVQKIEEHNKKFDTGEVTYTMGINQFADLTPEEFKQNHLGFRPLHKTKDNSKESQ